MPNLTPMERELLKSVNQLIERSDKSAKDIRLSADRISMATRRDMKSLSECVKLLAECQMRLVDWCRASAEEAAIDGSATRALAEVQQVLKRQINELG
ncbi:MAG: hypothetical protein R8G34_03585 [Paracoccaceae bacterium]|nr:hypothetical protein [Paracoccaceae bacterium]